MRSTINLYNGDCLESMPEIKDKSIDMILADLPYGITAYKWDVTIQFEPLWKQYERIIKDNGAIVLFGNEPFSSFLRISNIKLYKYDWYWRKNYPTGFRLCRKQPLRAIEIISIFYKKQPKYIPQLRDKSDRDIKKMGNNIKLKEYNSEHFNIKSQGNHEFRTIPKNKSYPINVLEYETTHNPNENIFHPTQKPVKLMEYLIKTYTNEGNLVLDNVMGSGTTGIACINLNRNFIGMELDKKYFEIAKKRIDIHKAQLQLYES